MSEVIPAVTTPTVDAPPPAAPAAAPPAPATEAPPVEAPAVETPTETGNWLMELAVNDGQDTSAEKTPLPAEALPESKASEPPPALVTPPADTAEAAPPLETKPEDEELTPEEQELVKSRPEAEQPELGRRLRTARFMARYKDPENPVEGIREHLEQQSPSRYGELAHAVIQHKLSNPSAFADEAYQLYPEAYGRFALEVFNGDPEFFIKHLTGKQLDVATLKAAVEQYDPTKPEVVPGSMNGVLTPDELEEVRLYLGDEVAEKIEKAAAAPPPPPPSPTPLAPDANQQKAIYEQLHQAESQKDQIFGSAVKVVDDYIGAIADDAKEGFGLKVSAEERSLAPDVADLKDEKRDLIIHGRGDLPPFEKGFAEWAREMPEVGKLLGKVWYYVDRGEEANAVEAAAPIKPYAKRYLHEVRMKHPLFARLDNRIKRAAAQANPKVENNAIIPGAPANSQPQASKADARTNFLLADALSVK